MKLKIIALTLAIFGMTAHVFAATITYSTLGRFNGGLFSSSPTLTVGSASLTFDGLGSTSVGVGNISYGTFDANAIGSGTIPAGTTFDLQVVQTAPTGGIATAAATLSGTLTTISSSVRVLFSSTSFTIGGILYDIDQPARGFAIVSPASNTGLTTIQGFVVPEPSSVVFFIIGQVMLSIASRKRA